LPHGKGWIHERGWLLEFLKAFNKAKDQIEVLVQEQMSRKN